MKKLISFLLITLSLFIVINCKKNNNENTASTISISGKVLDENENPISNVDVVSGTAQTATNASGEFTLTGLDKNLATLKIAAYSDDYFTGYKNVSNADGSNLFTQIVLITKSNIGTISATGGTVTTTGLKITAPANSFLNADETPYTGSVKVFARYISANDSLLLPIVMPGGDFMAQDSTQKDGILTSYGFTATEFTDNDGNKLIALPSVKIDITIPGNLNPVADGAKIWDFDPETSNWNKEKNLVKTGSQFTLPGGRTSGTTSLPIINPRQAQQTFKNIDKINGFGTIEGSLFDCTTNQPVSFQKIAITSIGTKPTNRYFVYTNKNGKFRTNVAATNNGVSYKVTSTNKSKLVSVYNNETATLEIKQNCIGSCTFIEHGITHNAGCLADEDIGAGGALGNIDVHSRDSLALLVIYNMPQAISGTFTILDGKYYYRSDKLHVLMSLNGTTLESKNGTVIKTGEYSFTFSCTMYDAIYNSIPEFLVTGSGNY